MNEITFENIYGCELPPDWKQRLDVRPDERVSITIRRIASNPSRNRFDRKTIQAILDRVAELPVLDDRKPEELLNYNEAGIPA